MHPDKDQTAGAASTIDMYGLTVLCRTASADLLHQMTRPFKYFLHQGALPGYTVTVEERLPPYDTFPPLSASFSTPRNIVYRDTHRKIIDFFGRGVVVENVRDKEFFIYGADPDFLIESFYLLVLSLFGQFCDRVGWLRLHALALSYRDTAVLLPLPSGSGKSTMALHLLRHPEFCLISDDAPVLDRAGHVRPYPLRIGTLDSALVEDIPSQHVYRLNRMGFGPKYFVDADYWRDRIEHRSLDKKLILISTRTLNGAPSIAHVARRKVLSTLVRDAVIGMGLYQGLEYLCTNSTWDVAARASFAIRRFRAALRLSLTAEPYQMVISRNPELNARLVVDFLQSRSEERS